MEMWDCYTWDRQKLGREPRPENRGRQVNIIEAWKSGR